MRCQGGPLDEQERDWSSSVVVLRGFTETGRYVRWWDIPDDFEPDWFLMGLPEPPKPERYYLWQPMGQYRDHPAVVAIREAVREASEVVNPPPSPPQVREMKCCDWPLHDHPVREND